MRRAVPIVLLAAAALIACGEEDEAAAPASPTSSVPPTTASPSPSPGVTETTSPSEEPSPTPTALPSPVTTSLEHGGTYFGLYLAVGPPGATELDDAVEQLADLGIEAYAGDLACDQGAAEQLGVGEDLMAVGLYFETRRDAQSFAGALDPAPVGIARVTTYCAD